MVTVMLQRIYRSDGDIRKQQINTLKIFNANVTEIQEGVEYRVAFNSGGNDLCLIVSLSSDFPNDKPLLKVSPVIVHPWVNADGDITSAPGLLNFTIHSDLGRVVQAVIREFERTPPPLARDHNRSSGITSPITIKDVERNSPNYGLPYSTLNNFSPPSQLALPSIRFSQSRSLFPELNNLTLNELQLLNDNVDKQDEFIFKINQVNAQDQAVEELLNSVQELAEANLSKKEHLKELRKVIEFRIEEVNKQTFENERLYNIYINLAEKFSPRNIQEEIRTACRTADQESEQIAETFLKGDIDVDKFVSSYVKNRTLYQSRKIKEEKLSQQLDSLSKAGF